VSSEMK